MREKTFHVYVDSHDRIIPFSILIRALMAFYQWISCPMMALARRSISFLRFLRKMLQQWMKISSTVCLNCRLRLLANAPLKQWNSFNSANVDLVSSRSRLKKRTSSFVWMSAINLTLTAMI